MHRLFTPAMLLFYQKAAEYLMIAFGGITLVVMNAVLTNDVKNGFSLPEIKRVVIIAMIGFVSAMACFTFVYVGDARAQIGKNVNWDRWAALATLQFAGLMLLALLSKVLWAL